MQKRWGSVIGGFIRSLNFPCVVVLKPGVLQVSSGEPVAQLGGGVQQLLLAMTRVEEMMKRKAGFCIGLQPLQI